jgi:hypothetical protein
MAYEAKTDGPLLPGERIDEKSRCTSRSPLTLRSAA